MKRVLTLAVAAMMVVTAFSGIVMADDSNPPVKFSNDGRNATYIATRFAPAGYSWSGNKLYPDRERNFEIGGTYTGWGRDGYLMPRCTYNPATGAVIMPYLNNERLYNIPATTATSVEPRFWCEFYLTVDPDGPESTETDHWFCVVDSGGNLWFDKDGFFHDSRYYAFADPEDILYNQDDSSLFDHCSRNPEALVDPIRANNTQGPYPFLPTDENGNRNDGYVDFMANNSDAWGWTGLGSTPMYFMDAELDRVFRIGWIDMIDFPLMRGGGADETHPWDPSINGALRETIVGGSHRENVWVTQASYWGIPADPYWQNRWDDWDYDMELVRFRDGAGADVGPDGPFWVFNQATNREFHWGEEWHAENLQEDGIYSPGEWIYRAGQIHAQFTGDNMVMGYDPLVDWEDDDSWVGVGDLRLTPVSVHIVNTGRGGQGGFTYNYSPGTVPIDYGQASGYGQYGIWDPGDDYDIGRMDAKDPVTGDPDPDPVGRWVVPFVMSPPNFGTPDPGLNPMEGDELHAENISDRLVGRSGAPLFDPYENIYRKGYTDTLSGRIQNTNDRVEYGDFRLSGVNSNAHPYAVQHFEGSERNRLGGMWIGDVLVLAEVLTAVANDKDFYNLSVETDLWEGMIPSQCTATIRSQVGEVLQRSQTVNQSTVVGPLPTSFAVPATSFMDCYITSRQYLGVEIFFDNGIDNNLGVQHYTNKQGDPPPEEKLYFNNLSDDYRPGSTCEQYLGAMDPNASLGNLTDAWAQGNEFDYDHYMTSMVGKDVGRILTSLEDLDDPPIRFRDSSEPGPYGQTAYYGCGEAIYADMNDDYEISVGDIRLTDMTVVRNGAIIEFKAGTTVNDGDTDVNAYPGASNDLNVFTERQFERGSWSNPMFYDDYTVNPNNPNEIIPPNGTFDPGEIIYDTDNWTLTYGNPNGTWPAVVKPGYQRLTGGWVGDTYYECGSIVPSFDYFLSPSVPYGITAGLNCDHRFLDWEVIPGDINLTVKVDKPLKVEQTSDIHISVDPPPRAGYWRDLGDHQVWIPDERVYVLVREGTGIDYISTANSDTNLFSEYRVLTPNSPEVTFTVTPYRGSCHPTKGAEEEMQYRVQAFKANPAINTFASGTKRAGIKVVPPDQHPYNYDPPRLETRHYYRDMWWSGDWYSILGQGRQWYKKNRRYGLDSPGLSIENETKRYRDLVPSPPLPSILGDHYDAYGEYFMPVAPEELEIQASVACITTLDQRFPNITLQLFNADNENDVNDPYGIPFSVPNTDQPIIAIYNAHGGGVNWLGVAEIANPINGEKVIFQANIDGTYEYWYWYEPANVDPDLGPQVPNAIDPNDVIIGEQWSTFPLQCTDEVKRTGVYVENRSNWEDVDCSAARDLAHCDIYLPDGMKDLGEVTGYLGMPYSSDHFGAFDGAYGWIVSYGVPTYVTPYGEVTPTDEGGECLVVVRPKDGSTHINLHVYLTNAIFDYNSTMVHPLTGGPYFRTDLASGISSGNPLTINMGNTVDGIDYAGSLDLKVYPPDPYVNFAEWLIVDKPLNYSNVNYTAGPTTNPAVSPLPPPAPQIQTPYWPILRTSHGGFRCYPGGQTHTGRVEGGNYNQNGGAFGWNAYPAIWSEATQKDYSAEKFYKLGTEFFPLADYGVYFILKDGEGNHLSFDADNIERQIKRIVIEGPFARPKVVDVLTNTVRNKYYYNGLKHVPIQYDYSGKLVIDETNWGHFERSPGHDFLNWSALGEVDYGSTKNLYMKRTGRLNYCSLDNVFVIDELIPWNYGKILLYVTLMDGTFKMYQDCCTSPPVDGIDVKALDLQQVNEAAQIDDSYEMIDFVTLDQDNYLSFILQEHEPIQVERYCNDAVMFCWQDRGIYLEGSEGILRDGAGDGWMTLPPTSSRAEGYHTQYREDHDRTNDNKIKFEDFETEICGTYDMATNTWLTGVIDARTFQRNGGRYDFELSKENGCQITELGLDFGGEEGEGDEPDHIISDNETLPLYVTAYKYGDDNNDRAFSPWWDFDPYFATLDNENKYDRTRFSHEVYLAAQVALPIEPFDDLIVTYTPNPLTAGITPELVDVNSPLTFIVKNSSGEAVNLLNGVPDQWGEFVVDQENVWNFLFKDPHPDNTYYYGREAMLPQYYYLRTDLHNYDKTKINNRELYSARERDSRNQCLDYITEAFEPIEFAADGEAGLYQFKGFCANDNNVWIKDEDHPDREQWEQDHLFRVYVYTPDRRHRGYVDVSVVNPSVEYEIVNTEDPTQQTFSVTGNGDADFIMTAGDNRMYKVKATVYNAQGQLVKGVTKGVSVCGGGVKNTARFTPFVTRPQSFDFMQDACDKVPCCDVVYPHLGFDFNANQEIEWENHELYAAGSFNLRPITDSCWNRQAVGEVYYNTINEFYRDDHTWNILNEGTTGVSVEMVNLMLPPPANMGWGLGAIYSWPYWGGFLFTDIDRNGLLDYHDSLGLDVNASTEFYVFAEDMFYIGGLIGQNKYCNVPSQADVVGYPPYSDKTNPRYTDRRFRGGVTNDTVFYLDWEGIPLNVAQVSYPRIELFYAENGEEVRKDLLNVDNYDMVFRADNHFIARIYPAFDGDIKLHEDGRLYVSGTQAQTQIFGQTKDSLEYSNATETTFHFMPDGTGQSAVYLSYLSRNEYFMKDPYQFESPEWYCLRRIYHLDVGKGLMVTVVSEGLAPNTETELTIRVQEIGSKDGSGNMMGVAEATVYIDGPGLEVTPKTTNAKGEVKVTIIPNAPGRIFISAEHEEYMSGKTWIGIGVDSVPPVLEVDALPQFTNKASIEVTGKTDPGSKVMVNGVAARVEPSGAFKASIALEEGLNTVYIEATDEGGNKTSHTMEIELDTTEPVFIIDGERNGEIVVDKNATEVKVTGRVEAYSTVLANGQPAECPYDKWEITIKMAANLDKLPVRFEFKDRANNTVSYDVTLVRGE